MTYWHHSAWLRQMKERSGGSLETNALERRSFKALPLLSMDMMISPRFLPPFRSTFPSLMFHTYQTSARVITFWWPIKEYWRQAQDTWGHQHITAGRSWSRQKSVLEIHRENRPQSRLYDRWAHVFSPPLPVLSTLFFPRSSLSLFTFLMLINRSGCECSGSDSSCEDWSCHSWVGPWGKT